MATIGTTDGTGGGWIAGSGSNNGGTVVGAGGTGVSPISNDLTVASIADDFGAAIGSKVVANDGTGAATTDRVGVGYAIAGSSGTLAFNPSPTGTRSETFVIRGVSTKLSGTANTALLSKGGHNNGVDPRQLHGTISSSSGTFAAGTYDVLAAPSTDITPNYTHGSEGINGTYTFQNTTDTTIAVSGEIFPTRAVPGELTYHFGGLGKPTTDEYKAKNAFEDATDTSS